MEWDELIYICVLYVLWYAGRAVSTMMVIIIWITTGWAALRIQCMHALYVTGQDACIVCRMYICLLLMRFG